MGHQPAEQPPGEEHAPTYEEVFGLELDLDEGSLPRAPEEDVQDLDADVDDGRSGRSPRRRWRFPGGPPAVREEFKARAEEAALRVKQREAELHEAASAPDPQR
jgi:hypothetical protein